MNLLKLICLTLGSLAKQAWQFPQSVALAHKKKSQRIALDEFESDRLDRLRNPSKYLGK
jgi:hypothetical protein